MKRREEGKKYEDIGEGFPQILHDRSRASGAELQRYLISLATGSLAVYFVALTASDTNLTKWQQLAATTCLLLMAIAVFSGIAGWYADSRRYYFWGSARQATKRKDKKNYYRSRHLWEKRRKILANILGFSFLLGIVTSVIYMILRVINI